MLPAWANAATLGCVLLANAALGRRIGKRSRQFDSALSPAGPAFSIWGAIYALLAVAVLDQGTAARTQLGLWFALSSLFSIGWLAVFTLGSVERGDVRWVAAGMLQAAAVCAMPLVRPGTAPVGAAAQLARVGLSIYAGWLVVAAALGTAIAANAPPMASRRWRGAAWLAVLVAPGAGSVVLRDPALVAPVAWAALWRATRGDGVAAAACAVGVAVALGAGVARVAGS
jgi:hypothetical protein